MNKQTITDFYGKIIGYVSTDEKTGNKTATDFYGRILGYYKKDLNLTTDFYGKIVARGDAVTGLVYGKEEGQGKK
jgi:hypothetical protein